MVSRSGKGIFIFVVLMLATTLDGLAQQPAPAPSAARILLLPRKIVSGERATLAVLDVNGRLTPGVQVKFSNGDHYSTDQSGRALFVAPLNPGVIFAAIAGRAGRVQTAVIAPTSESTTPGVSFAPVTASLADRFDVVGHGFCGDADSNTVIIGGRNALVLAASPTSLVLLPPNELSPGTATVEISCGKTAVPAFSMTFLGLELHANAAPLAPGEHRKLSVTVAGTSSKISLEAKNLAPEIAELAGGDTVRRLSSGGAENSAHFEVVGRRRGNFIISIHLVPVLSRPAVQ